jgi:diadenosine tetraphosphate (Ap4A) HIT family hydrolase
MPAAGCPLCDTPGGELVFSGAGLRVVRTDEGGFPAFYRLIWHRHVREFSQLHASERALCTEALAAVEQVLLAHLNPEKINLASLGNAVPHLHWHVVARFAWDSHFPAPVWAAPVREAAPVQLQRVLAARTAIAADIAHRLARLEAATRLP